MVNRYLLKPDSHRALVLYWCQGRGRVEANEYIVKWDLLRDAAVRRRTEEALVRIVVPIRVGEMEVLWTGLRLAQQTMRSLWRALPR